MTLKMLADSLAQNRTFYHFNPLFIRFLEKKMSGKGTRILQVFKALHNHPLIGISNTEIADNLGFTPPKSAEIWQI